MRFRIILTGGGFNTSKMAPTCRLPWRGARQRINGGCPSSPYPAPHISVFLNVSHASWSADPPPEPRVSVYKWVSLCAGPLTGRLGFQVFSISPRWWESPLVFTVRFGGTFLLGTGTWAEQCLCLTRAPCSFRGDSAATHSLPLLNLQSCVQDEPASHLHPLYQIDVALSLYPQTCVLWSARLQVIFQVVCFIIWMKF